MPIAIPIKDSHGGGNDNDKGGEGGYPRRLQNSNEPDLEATVLYLHIILLDKGFTKKQVPIPLINVSNDYDLFV